MVEGDDAVNYNCECMLMGKKTSIYYRNLKGTIDCSQSPIRQVIVFHTSPIPWKYTEISLKGYTLGQEPVQVPAWLFLPYFKVITISNCIQEK